MNFSLLMFDTALMPVFADAMTSPAPDGAWISTAAISALCAGVGAILGKLWPSKVRVKRPLDTNDTFVTTDQCKQHRCALEKRIDEIKPLLKDISEKLSSSSARAEERAVQLHRRLDPIVEKVAANAAELDLIKDINFKGGKK